MEKLKVCFVGVGSIAKRHIRNLRILCVEKGIEIEIDALRREYSTVDGVDHVFCNESEVHSNYDVIFITNPTEYHLKELELLDSKSRHFFIEKPVVSISQVERAKQYKEKNGAVYYVACPLRYCSVIQFLKMNIDPADVISVRSISSSYLPEWRPGTDYRKTYSAHKNMGGGVSIDLIHEWDYLTFLFGFPKAIQYLIGKKSYLEIDSDDYAVYIADYNDKVVELHLDYFGRKTIREIQLMTKVDTIIADILNNRIIFLKSGKTIEFNEDRDGYQKKELDSFIAIISGQKENESDFRHGIKVLELTQGLIV